MSLKHTGEAARWTAVLMLAGLANACALDAPRGASLQGCHDPGGYRIADNRIGAVRIGMTLGELKSLYPDLAYGGEVITFGDTFAEMRSAGCALPAFLVEYVPSGNRPPGPDLPDAARIGDLVISNRDYATVQGLRVGDTLDRLRFKIEDLTVRFARYHRSEPDLEPQSTGAVEEAVWDRSACDGPANPERYFIRYVVKRSQGAGLVGIYPGGQPEGDAGTRTFHGDSVIERIHIGRCGR